MSGEIITTRIVGSEAVQAKFLSAGPAARERVRKEVESLGLEALRRVKQNKLTGQVLKVQTGRLRRSINEKTTVEGDSIVSSVGTNVGYGAAWEKGFHGSFAVKAHIRRIKDRSTFFIKTTKKGEHKMASQGIAFVKGHMREVNQKPRPFLVPVLNEMKADVRRRLLAVVAKGM